MTDAQRPADDSPPLWDDTVVEEVREVRQRLWEASGRNIQRFIERSRQSAERREVDRRDNRGTG